MPPDSPRKRASWGSCIVLRTIALRIFGLQMVWAARLHILFFCARRMRFVRPALWPNDSYLASSGRSSQDEGLCGKSLFYVSPQGASLHVPRLSHWWPSTFLYFLVLSILNCVLNYFGWSQMVLFSLWSTLNSCGQSRWVTKKWKSWMSTPLWH